MQGMFSLATTPQKQLPNIRCNLLSTNQLLHGKSLNKLKFKSYNSITYGEYKII